MFLSPAKSTAPPQGGASAAFPRRWLVCAALALAIFAAYAGVVHCDFVDYDDNDYIVNNTPIQNGLNGPAIAWAFTTGWASNWHPLTWISHTIDFSLFGLNPLGYHVENVLWHAANAILLFLWLQYLTSAFWRSAIVAGFFALHPAHVESVAWVAERKDLLSTCFWIITVWLYTAYVRETALGAKRATFYLASLVAFAIALLCKPMVVTLPCILLLLDFWPLHRPHPWPRLVFEKIPFFLLSAAESVITVVVQKNGGALASTVKYTIPSRLENTPVAYARYLQKLFFPSGLTMYYRHLKFWPISVVVLSILILIALTALALRLRRRQPYVLVGWLWFLGMIFPTIGLLQVGAASMADRYTYLSSVGLFIAVAWGVAEWLQSIHRRAVHEAVSFVTALAILACALISANQVTYWRDTGTLFRHAMRVSGSNYVAFYNVACWLMRLQKFPQAEACLVNCLKQNPEYPYAYNDLAFLQLKDGRYNDAVTNLLQALRFKPDYPEAFINLARADAALNRNDGAISNFQSALRLRPKDPETQFRLGSLLLQEHAVDRALPELQSAVEAAPNNVSYQLKLAAACLASGQISNAVKHYEAALQLDPNLPEACNNLAWIMAASPNPALRDGQLALSLARHAVQLSPTANPLLLGTLAAAAAEAGQFDDALRAATQARQLALAQNDAALISSLDAQLNAYRNHQPFRDPRAQ